jgi:4-amino-4-deoxy-L-arabinose transferase-like glycosyltransferase
MVPRLSALCMISYVKKNSSVLILSLIILIAVVLRFYQLGSNPPSLDWDEASLGYNAYSILKTGADEYGNKFPLSFRSFDDYKPPVYVYLTVPSVAFFGLTEAAVRLPAAIIGVIAVVALYFLVLEILHSWDMKRRQWIALMASFSLALSPWHLQFSRAAFEGNIGICFLILSLLFFFKGLKKNWYYFLFAIFFVLSLYSYHSFRLVNPLLLIALCTLFFKELLKHKIIVGLSFLIIVLTSLPVYASFIHSEGTGARLSMVTIFSDQKLQQLSARQVAVAKQNHDKVKEILYNRRFIFIPQIAKGYLDHFNFDFLFLHGDGGVQHHAYNMGMLYLWDFPFILLGIFYLFKKRDRRILVLFILFLLAPLPASITSGTPHPVRAIAMIPTFQIFAAVGFVVALSFLLKRKKMGRIMAACIVVALCLNVGYYLNSYYVQTPIKYGYFWQYGNKEAILYAKQHEDEYDQIIMTYKYDQPYIYYLFYNKIDPTWWQKNWDNNGDGTINRFYRKIDKYEFMEITDKQLIGNKTLIIGTDSETQNSIGKLKKEIRFPDGRLAYRIIAL